MSRAGFHVRATKEKLSRITESKIFYVLVGFILGLYAEPSAIFSNIGLGWWIAICFFSLLLTYVLYVRYKLNQDYVD